MTENFQPQSQGPQATENRFLTISNLLSISRAILAIPFAAVMLSDSPHATAWGIAILAAAALTDKLDGVFARKFNQVTEWGKILDPVADKLGIAVVAITLLMLKLIPLWFVIAMVARDLLILAGGMYVKKRTGMVLQSNVLGKWTIGAIALAMFFAMIHWESTATAFLWLTIAMLAVSLALYVQRFLEVVKSQAK